MTVTQKFYVIRQSRRRVIGSPAMTRAAADREAKVWGEEIGPARVFPVTRELAAAVRAYDQAVLVPLLGTDPASLHLHLIMEARQCPD